MEKALVSIGTGPGTDDALTIPAARQHARGVDATVFARKRRTTILYG